MSKHTMSRAKRNQSISTAPGEANFAGLHTVINLSRMLEGDITRHYDRFLDEHLTISLLRQWGQEEDFVFEVSSSRKGHSPYRVNVWRQYHACPYASEGFGPCSKHGDVVGFCICQANREKHLMCKHLAAGYVEARRILTGQGRAIRPIDLDYWHPEVAISSTTPLEHDPWELAQTA